MLLLMCFSRNVVLEKYYISTVLRRVKRLWDCPNFIKLGYVFQEMDYMLKKAFGSPSFTVYFMLCAWMHFSSALSNSSNHSLS